MCYSKQGGLGLSLRFRASGFASIPVSAGHQKFTLILNPEYPCNSFEGTRYLTFITGDRHSELPRTHHTLRLGGCVGCIGC